MRPISPAALLAVVCLCASALAATRLILEPATGPPVSTVRLQGEVPAGNTDVRFYWEEGGELQTLAAGTADSTGVFAASVQVPAGASPGAARIGVLPAGGAVDELVFADFEVVPPAPAGIAGTVEDANGAGVGAGTTVRLLDPAGLTVAETVTDNAGRFAFSKLPPSRYVVQTVLDGYPPASEDLPAGASVNLVAKPVPAALNFPPVYLVGAGAIALPGGSFSGSLPAEVGEWSDTPFARLVSLKGKGLAPVNVRFWARVQRVLLPSDAPLIIGFALKKGGQIVASAPASSPTPVFNQSPFDFPAFTADFNSLELPPGKLTLSIIAVSTFFTEVGHWEFPVAVVGLGDRWYAGHVQNPQLKVTREDFYQLRYEFKGTLPGGIPGLGTPLFDDPVDLKFKTVENTFNLGIALTERFYTYGGWSGQAAATAQVTLLDIPVINEQRALNLTGASLPSATYSLPPWTVPLPGSQCVPLWGAALPSPIDLCGLKFNGQVGVVLCLDGQVSLGAQVQPNLQVGASVTPALNVTLPVGADVEAAICEATANIKPSAALSAPIILDAAHSPPVYWDGLCLKLSAKANLALTCCGFGFDKSVNLFDPITIGNCPAALQIARMAGTDSLAFAPPRHASIAFSPDGFALAVWENYVTRDGVVQRTAPVYSVYDGASWAPPQPIAGDEFAGWEPHVAFLDARRAVAVWVRPNPQGGRRGAVLAGPEPHSVCDTIGDLVDFGCGLIGGAVDIVTSVWDSIFFARARGLAGARQPAISGNWEPPVALTDDLELDVRPVLASNPATDDATLVWLREQRPVPGGQRALALYYSRLTAGTWSAPQRVDPASTAFDLQPTLRYDHRGQPNAVWVRDPDGDLGTPDDRSLVISTLGRGSWSAPEALASLPAAPWTPSLDFDANDQPVVAFVVPPVNSLTGGHLTGDGLLSTLHVAHRTDRGWTAQPVGEGTQAARPRLRVTPDNHALVVFRGFGTPTDMRPAGEVAAAVADLGTDASRWTLGRLTADDRLNWQIAAELNPRTGEPLLFWETRDPADMTADPQLRQETRAWAVDLTFDESGLVFSTPHPDPGVPVQITARLTNAGLKPLGAESLTVSFYDRQPTRDAVPFATQTVRGPLGFGEVVPVTAAYTPADRSLRTIYVVADAANAVAESDEANNQLEARLGGLAAPQDLEATPEPGGLRLRWTRSAAPDALRYWVWRTRTGSPVAELVGATSADTFLDATAQPGEDYAYQLAAFDGQGVRSTAVLTPPVTVAPPEPATPDSLHLSVVAFRGAVTLTWTALPAVQLEVTEALVGAQTRWVPVSEGIEQLGGVAQLTLPAVQQQFFRLVVP